MVLATDKIRPTVLHIPTASGDPINRIEEFVTLSRYVGLEPSVLPLFHSQSWTARPEELIAKADMIWVGGGSTYNMLQLWKAWDIVEPLYDAYNRGCVIGGVSAGAICWFEQGSTDSLGPGFGVMECLGWLSGSCVPHWSGEPVRRQVVPQQLADGTLKPGIALDDGCAVHLVNEQIEDVIAENETAWAYEIAHASIQPIRKIIRP